MGKKSDDTLRKLLVVFTPILPPGEVQNLKLIVEDYGLQREVELLEKQAEESKFIS